MADKGTYRLEKSHKGKWEIWREGAKRPSSTHQTKADAQERMRAFQRPTSKSAVALPASAARKPAVSAVLKNLEGLSSEDLLQVAQKAESLAKARQLKLMKPRKSLAGIMADLGPPPTWEEIEQARREMWGRSDKVAP